MDLRKFIVEKEYIKPVKMKVVHGKIPCDLSGTYYKNGPAWREKDIEKLKHIFDGNGYITKIRFDKEEAFYQGRYVWERESGERKGPDAFGGPLFNGLPFSNKANTNVVYWGGDLVAFYEGGCPIMLDEETLAYKGVFPGYRFGWPINVGCIGGDVVNAHPKIDHNDDRMVALDLKFGLRVGFGLGLLTYFRFREFNSNKEVAGEVEISVTGFGYIHDWGMTESYYIFVQHPLRIEPGDWKKGIAMCLVQENVTGESIIWIIDRKTGDKRCFGCGFQKDFFISHFVSCFESEKYIEIVALCYKEYPFGKGLEQGSGC